MITTNLTVPAGITLWLEPGVELRFSANVKLLVQGSLVIRGIVRFPVKLTSNQATPTRGFWPGVEIGSTATAAVIDYARIEYAAKGLYFNGTTASLGAVTHSLIQNNSTGIYVNAPNASPTITNGNEITANQQGIWVQGNSNAAQNPLPVVTGNSIHDNLYSGLTYRDYYAVTFGNPGSTVLNATGNWWGTTDTAVIATHITDFNDSTTSPRVDYTGFLDSPGGQPFVGLYNVIITQSSAKPLQSVDAQGSFVLNTPASVTSEIHRESDDAIVFSNSQGYPTGGQYAFAWNGRDNNGNAQSEGLYRIVLIATAGTATSTYDPPQPTTLGSVSGSVPLTYDPFRNSFWKINITMTSPGLLSLQATPQGGAMFSILNQVYYPAGQSWVYWDGRDPSGQIVPQTTAMYFPAPSDLRSTALTVTGTRPVISGSGVAPNIEVKSNPYLIVHSYEEISTFVYRVDLDSYVTVKLLPPGIYDPGNSAAVVLVNNELQLARDAGGQPIDHAVEWRGYDLGNTNHIASADEGVFTFSIEARSQLTNLPTLYRGVLQIRR